MIYFKKKEREYISFYKEKEKRRNRMRKGKYHSFKNLMVLFGFMIVLTGCNKIEDVNPKPTTPISSITPTITTIMEELEKEDTNQEKVEKEEVHEHHYMLASQIEATCTEAGEATYICTCGDSYTETLEASHNFVEQICTKCSTKLAPLRSSAGEITYSHGFLGSSSENSDVIRALIVEISFCGASEAVGHYITDSNCWDASDAQDESILGWYEKHQNALGKYSIFIAPAKENIVMQAHKNSSYLFANLCNTVAGTVKISGLENIDFSETTDLSYCFAKTQLSQNFILNINTSQVKNVAYMYQADSYNPIVNTILFGEQVDFSNVENTKKMFENQKELTELTVPKGLSIIGL